MHTLQAPSPQESNEFRINDIASVGDELTDDDLMLAVGGLTLIDIEVVSYIDGKVFDHQIDIFYI